MATTETTALVKLDPQALITQALTSNASIETVEKLVALAERIHRETSRQAFHRAMAEFQRRAPVIPKTKRVRVPTRGGGSYSYKYAPLDRVMRLIRPILADVGLTPSWSSPTADATSVTLNCVISHEMGYEKDFGPTRMPLAVGDDGRGMNNSQRVGSATTYAQRYSLMSALGLVAEGEDNDGAGADDRDPPGSFSAAPKRATPGVSEADRPKLTADAKRLATQRNLTTEESLQLTKDYLHGEPLSRAAVGDLDQLQMFLGDPAAVDQWRSERARDLEDGKP